MAVDQSSLLNVIEGAISLEKPTFQQANDAEHRSVAAHCEIALVSMPFAFAQRPSMQIGLLKAIVASKGFQAASYHLSLDLAKQIGMPLYSRISQVRGMLGEWLFSMEAFPDCAPDRAAKFLVEFSEDLGKKLVGLDCSIEHLRYVRDAEIPRYLDELIGRIPWGQYIVVGFTSTFQQTIPSIALARRIKLTYPHVRTVFGGANFEAGMGLELVRTVPWIDFAVIGEGDTVLPELLRAMRNGDDPATVPGVASCQDGELRFIPQTTPYHAMDDLPTPDYSEFFERAEMLEILPREDQRTIELPFESARGCWWGAKHHCTCCGLNGPTMQFRSKSPDRLLQEIAELARRHGSFRFEAVDNIIDHSYFKSLLPRFVELNTDYSFFYELKSNLTRDQIRLLAQAGVRRIQPGLESLSSRVLKLMKKGVTAIQNVNTLRWSLYYGLEVPWNLIWGFPGETAEDYRDHEELIPRLLHLRPPGSCGRFWMERFSPAFTDRASFPVRYMKPESGYFYVYPSSSDIDAIAYFFDYEFSERLSDEAYQGTARLVGQWKDIWAGQQRPTLTYWSAPDFLQIEDRRDSSARHLSNYQKLPATLYVACSDKPMTIAALQGSLGVEAAPDAIEEALLAFCSQGLMMRDGNQFLSLGLPATANR